MRWRLTTDDPGPAMNGSRDILVRSNERRRVGQAEQYSAAKGSRRAREGDRRTWFRKVRGAGLSVRSQFLASFAQELHKRASTSHDTLVHGRLTLVIPATVQHRGRNAAIGRRFAAPHR